MQEGRGVATELLFAETDGIVDDRRYTCNRRTSLLVACTF